MSVVGEVVGVIVSGLRSALPRGTHASSAKPHSQKPYYSSVQQLICHPGLRRRRRFRLSRWWAYHSKNQSQARAKTRRTTLAPPRGINRPGAGGHRAREAARHLALRQGFRGWGHHRRYRAAANHYPAAGKLARGATQCCLRRCLHGLQTPRRRRRRRARQVYEHADRVAPAFTYCRADSRS